jgi:hypothetical protein
LAQQNGSRHQLGPGRQQRLQQFDRFFVLALIVQGFGRPHGIGGRIAVELHGRAIVAYRFVKLPFLVRDRGDSGAGGRGKGRVQIHRPLPAADGVFGLAQPVIQRCRHIPRRTAAGEVVQQVVDQSAGLDKQRRRIGGSLVSRFADGGYELHPFRITRVQEQQGKGNRAGRSRSNHEQPGPTPQQRSVTCGRRSSL